MTADERNMADPPIFDPVRALIEDITSGKSPEVIVVQSDVLRHLNRSQTEPRKDAKVRRSLDIARKVGRKELGDLLYELTRVCLFANTSYEYAENTRKYVEPRDAAGLRSNIDAMNTRLGADVPIPANVPRTGPTDAQALNSARACIDVSEDILGTSLPTTYQRAEILMRLGRLEEALEIAERLLRSGGPPLWNGYVHARRTSILLRLNRPEECVQAANEAISKFPDNSVLLFNVSTAHAMLGHVTAWEDVATRFSRTADTRTSVEFWRGVLRREALWMAPLVHRTSDEVLARFGAPLKGRGQ